MASQKETASFTFPIELKEAVRGLDNDTRWKIIEMLAEHGQLSYSKLLNELNIENNNILNNHLKVLSETALVNRTEDFKKETNERSFYDISTFGRRVVNGLMSAIAIPEPVPPFSPTSVSFDLGKLIANDIFLGVMPMQTVEPPRATGIYYFSDSWSTIPEDTSQAPIPIARRRATTKAA